MTDEGREEEVREEKGIGEGEEEEKAVAAVQQQQAASLT